MNDTVVGREEQDVPERNEGGQPRVLDDLAASSGSDPPGR